MTTDELKTAIISHALTWPIEDYEMEKFIQLSRDCGSAEIVIDRWEKFNRNNRARKTPALFFEWWELNRPDVEESEEKPYKRKIDSISLPGFDNVIWRK